MNPTILLTFDVEDWFQVENFKQYIPFSSWSNCELRVEKNVHRILDLLDSINCNTAALHHRNTSSSPSASPLPPHGSNSSLCSMPAHRKVPVGGCYALCEPVKATFFVLGWIAERLPHLVREIQGRGHEVASHGYSHELCREQSTEDLKNDLVKSKQLLEDITGDPVYGYRAPSFSIDQNTLGLLEGAGYLYDSSFNSFRLNRRYGQLDLVANNGYNGISLKISDKFYELPISNLKIGKQFFPWGGGGYFRLIPSYIFKQGVENILRKHGAYLFYLHPWEIDPNQPRLAELPITFKFRHYANLDKTYSKLSLVLNCFKEYNFSTLIQYINRQTQQTQ